MNQWEENYNNFNPAKSPKTGEKQPRGGGVTTTQNVATRESNINTPNKLLMTTPGHRKNLQTRFVVEEVKLQDKLPFEVADDHQ